jgi:FO synthase
MAGSGNGSLKTIAELEAMAAGIGRPARQRTTDYGTPSAERMATARSDAGRRALTLKLV